MNILLKFLGRLNRIDYLKNFACSTCQKLITDQDLNQKNYLLGISNYANEINQYYNAQQQPVYEVRLWLKTIEHQTRSKEVSHE